MDNVIESLEYIQSLNDKKELREFIIHNQETIQFSTNNDEKEHAIKNLINCLSNKSIPGKYIANIYIFVKNVVPFDVYKFAASVKAVSNSATPDYILEEIIEDDSVFSVETSLQIIHHANVNEKILREIAKMDYYVLSNEAIIKLLEYGIDINAEIDKEMEQYSCNDYDLCKKEEIRKWIQRDIKIPTNLQNFSFDKYDAVQLAVIRYGISLNLDVQVLVDHPEMSGHQMEEIRTALMFNNEDNEYKIDIDELVELALSQPDDWIGLSKKVEEMELEAIRKVDTNLSFIDTTILNSFQTSNYTEV